jgi:NAD(P)H-hydrate epimerase
VKQYFPDKNHDTMTRQQVMAFDDWAINSLGIPGVVLMENAGRSCAELIEQKLTGIERPRVCIFCGTGNNGGDGYVIARHLRNAGAEVAVAICGDRSKIKGDARTNLDILERLGQHIEVLSLSEADISVRLETLISDTDVIVDAIFGTGFTGQLRDNYRRLIECINEAGVPVLAVDIPSGLDCDTGRPLPVAIKAAWTVTFAAAKAGFQHKTARDYTGDIFVACIGVEPAE